MERARGNWYQGIVAGVIVAVSAFAPPAYPQNRNKGPDAQIQADVTKALDKKQFKDVTATVDSGIVKLSGVVATYADKVDADRLTTIAGR